MLEGLVAWILNNYLGKYVENLNTDQLSIALLSGKVELENLPLRKDALRSLQLPVEVKAGLIGKVKLQIPVRQIRSAPWVIAIEKLYLIASPLNLDECDAVSEELATQELKISALDTLEARWRLETDSKDGSNSGYYASSYTSWLNFGTGIISDIVENIQLNIQDVHIRYEDSFSIPDRPFAFGITLESLAVQSCDANWAPGFSSWAKGLESFKLLEMQKFAIYWVHLDKDNVLANLDLAELTQAMSPNQTAKITGNHILPPVSAQVHLKRNRSEQPLRSPQTPRIVCDLLLSEVPLMLVDWQYNQMVKAIRGLNDVARFRVYRRYKPARTVKEDPRAWWMYAICGLYPGGKPPAICRPKPTWESCLKQAKENVAYVTIYRKHLVAPTITLSPEEKQIKDSVEWDREFDELKDLRQIAMQSVSLPSRNTPNANSTGRSMLVNWFPTWMGWYSSSTTDNTTQSSLEASQLEGEILQALADSAENNSLLKRDAVFGHFNFCLKRGSLNLCTTVEDSDECAPMLELEFKNLCLNILSKPRSSSHLIELSLDALHLKDKITVNTMFPVLVGPPGLERSTMRNKVSSSKIVAPKNDDQCDYLFYMAYEKKPVNSACDYRLCVRTKSLDVVYQPNAVRWLTEFLFLPHQRNITHSRIEAMKTKTKKELIKNWEHILDGKGVARTSWELELDISAPQIIFVERFTDQNSAIIVIDFGILQLKNNVSEDKKTEESNQNELVPKESEEDEMFLTPCSTPPQSEASESDEQITEINTLEQLPQDTITEASLHQKLYDRYCVELTDSQILIGKIKDNWRSAHNKGTSTLHILDRFNISLQIERRIVHTLDPRYPSVTLSANLPKLVAHVNENKINSARTLFNIISATGLPSPFKTPENVEDFITEAGKEDDDSTSLDTSIEMSRLLMVQFTIDQMSLELQSRGRCVAELQVAGVRVGFTKRPTQMDIALTVHSLLLVDALQTFGPDFELLVASHKHVGMDSISGSIRDSEPTSPVSPASPDPSMISTTSPVALKQALNSLATSPPDLWSDPHEFVPVLDDEALIIVRIKILPGQEQNVNIQFNNLDIIANQETIVELMGFLRRVFPKSQKPTMINLQSIIPSSLQESVESIVTEESTKLASTEIRFDFYRLNVLLLRGVVRDGILYGKKICTATMSEAKIEATVDEEIRVKGSLGGLQVLDLTPEGQMHQRIVSVGRDPLQETPHPLYKMSYQQQIETAFSFGVIRNLYPKDEKDVAKVTVRMASLWYTHSPQFILELQSCATEFKQYMANLARSIKSAATDMALGLVHARAEALAQSLYMNASSIYGSALSLTDTASPRKRRRSSSVEASGYSTAKDSIPQTPCSPTDGDDFIIDIKLDIELESPVVILPRASNSSEVFIAHLGRISISNKHEKNSDVNKCSYFNSPDTRIERHDIEVRDMNVFSLDISGRRVPGPMVVRPEVLYNCDTFAKPILHDTVLQLSIEREINRSLSTRQSNENIFADDDDASNYQTGNESLQITGNVVTALKVSLTRSQYEQVLDTVQWLTTSPVLMDIHGVPRTSSRQHPTLTDISEEDIGVPTLNMDPHIRAKMFPTVSATTKSKPPKSTLMPMKVAFDLPIFTIELRGDAPTGEQGLVDLSFRDFLFNYEKSHKYETNIQVSLRSIFMEDLLQPEGCKQRSMVVSSWGNEVPTGSNCVSKSCPDVTLHPHLSSPHGSLPDHLETTRIFGMHRISSNAKNIPHHNQNNDCYYNNVDTEYPCTPPPSPSHGRDKSEKNLVIISTLLVDPSSPEFETCYNSIQRSTSVDFNCLDLVVNVESWVVVIDFFSASPSKSFVDGAPKSDQIPVQSEAKTEDDEKGKEETNITVKSLTVVLVKPDRDIAKANISNVEISIRTGVTKKEVDGKLGSMSLLDLTLHGQLYRERFLTTGKHALQFNYIRESSNETKEYDAQLKLKMSSVMYVHTKRFVAELQAFFNHFTQLQAVMQGIRAATSGQDIHEEPLKLSLILKAGSPIMLLPVSSKSSDLLVADLGQLLVTNTFKFSGDKGTISVANSNSTDKKCLLEVMFIELQNMDLYAGFKESEFKSAQKEQADFESFKLGSTVVVKKGCSLLTEKCQLRLQVERNLNSAVSHIVPDMSIYGQLSTLDGALDQSQYKLIRGLLAFNLSEDTERILPSVNPPPINAERTIRDLWTLSSLKLDLQNVTLRLRTDEKFSTLTCINFIKSRLTVENYSNFCQDVDLVSQEILVMDSRFDELPLEKKCNVFTNILQPIKDLETGDRVQAEVHSRKRQDRTKFTVLLNNMRLMAIFDWWEAVRDFILVKVENVASSPEHHKMVSANKKIDNTSLELKLNITDSEIVVVEDTAQWDSNAVILKSTTVISYRDYHTEKPLSCNLNNCEMFSCVLGLEEETALSIIDPVTLNLDINKDSILEAQLHFLTVRLSYHDMKMFLGMLNSLPKQMFAYKQSEAYFQPAFANGQVTKLKALGFSEDDCVVALEHCNNNLEDSALWLTQHAQTVHHDVAKPEKGLSVRAIEVKASCISICIIDDCGDSDVPLLELSLSKVNLNQFLPDIDVASAVYPQGSLECVLAGDYYNRMLSGWEPFLEPWKCRILWEKSLTSDMARNRFTVRVESKQVLNVNITSTLIELYKQVKESWTKDYYSIRNTSCNQKQSNSHSYRTRSPFVPFALKNDTGSPLRFKTLIVEINRSLPVDHHMPDESWITVAPGDTIPFTFRSRTKLRHQDSHKMKIHQLGVQIEGWQSVAPVTIDKVGTYFRHAAVQIQHRMQQEIPPARIVFDVALEGSARKLVTVRSAVLLINKLPHQMEVKLESQLPHDAVTLWVASKVFSIESETVVAVPLVHAHSQISVRPCGFQYPFTFCLPPLSWNQMPANVDRTHESRICHTHKGHHYRFTAEVLREKHLIERVGSSQPAHRIILLPTVKLVNLLPIDLGYILQGARGVIHAGSSASLTEVDPEQYIDLEIAHENFKVKRPISISGITSEFVYKVHMEDRLGRKLYLQGLITPNKGAKLKVTISAPYWIINRTGLPLVFRQAGASTESGGQFEENEVARMVAPLLFSFSDQDASPTISARVGKHVVRDGSPQWCANFHCQKSTQVRKLHVTMKDGRPDTVFVVGIEIRPGRGKYRSTSIITVAPRYQLHNRSSYELMFAQLCYANGQQNDPREQRLYLKAMPNSHMPFHWPRLDKDQLLCVSIRDIPECGWSGGLLIDSNASMHVNVRDANGRVYFLRLEVVLQGATFFIVFTDADTMPPPFRIDNYSEVPLRFAQNCCRDTLYSIARAHTSVPYAWDKPTEPSLMTVVAPGGVSCTYDMNKLGEQHGLTYENFIYIAFTATFKNHQDVLDPLDVESQELVLDVVKGNQVVLSRKGQGQRSQLWRMTTEGHLQHEGSSPPLHPHQSRSADNILVLDIDNTAVQPNTYSRLMLRRLDPRRRSTQTWRFTEDGRLCCAYYNMCVQAQDGFFGLREGNAAVLGLPQPVCHKVTEKGVPIEQAVGRQRLRPGSGFLSVEILMDGPTRVLCIKDIKEKSAYAKTDERDWCIISRNQRPNLKYSDVEDKKESSSEVQFTVNVEGLGISVVCKKAPEELLYALFSNIVGETVVTPAFKRFCISIGNIQVDDQLFEAPVPVVLYVTPPGSRNSDEGQHQLPAIQFNAELPHQVNENAVIFKHLILHLKKITIILEERLLLKLFAFLGFNAKEEEMLNKDENDYETQRILSEVSAAHAKRYYFGLIHLMPDEIRLSVKTASKLPPHLQKIKRKLGLTLIKFEDAAILLEAFDRRHPFETSQVLINSIIRHFKDELMWQAATILGSIDYLGNPLGFFSDVSEGLEGLCEGNVGALVKNVTHGISNSAAKVAESLSDGLGRISMDDQHEEIRQKIRQVDTGRSRDHIAAGIKGLGLGFLGGATGIFRQVYEGFGNDGVPGVFSGLGKGLVGAVTKPVVGVLDLASETARAVRDSSKSKLIPERYRPPRCVYGPGGLLPKYNFKQSQGQQYLYVVNDKDYKEHLIAYEVLGSASEDLQCIVSNEKVRIVATAGTADLMPVIECSMSDLETCNVIIDRDGSEERYYIEIVMHVTGISSAIVNPDPVKKPRVRCRTHELAKSVMQQINYAKRLYIERLYTLNSDNINISED